jgi:hypothetical protein
MGGIKQAGDKTMNTSKIVRLKNLYVVSPKTISKEISLLSDEMLKERTWLYKNFKLYGELSEEYKKRAMDFNKKCDEIGIFIIKIPTGENHN